MLELFSSGILSLWLKMSGVDGEINQGVQRVIWQMGLPTPVVAHYDPLTADVMQQYLKTLQKQGLAQGPQGIWLEAGGRVLSTNQGNLLLPGASLTKIATSLTALQKLGPHYRFETRLRRQGVIRQGVLQGDLIIQGSGDPLFIWEEAISLGNSLHQLGIHRITGHLIITGNFLMNYESNPGITGELFRMAIDQRRWSPEVIYWYSKMPPKTKKPQVTILGNVLFQKNVLSRPLLIKHQSLKLVEILKQMNVHSDNNIAQLMANFLGGAKVVQQEAIWMSGLSSQDIQLGNGSGLGEENQMTPRAACAMFKAFERYLQRSSFTVADFFPVAGRDKGTLELRRIPSRSVVKTGTLDRVIALAGFLPTRKQGLVCFGIINRGTDWDGLRSQQDVFLQNLVKVLQPAPQTPPSIQPHLNGNQPGYGQPQRNQLQRTKKAL